MAWLNRIGIILEFLSFWLAAPEILGEERLRALERGVERGLEKQLPRALTLMWLVGTFLGVAVFFLFLRLRPAAIQFFKFLVGLTLGAGLQIARVAAESPEDETKPAKPKWLPQRAWPLFEPRIEWSFLTVVCGGLFFASFAAVSAWSARAWGEIRIVSLAVFGQCC